MRGGATGVVSFDELGFDGSGAAGFGEVSAESGNFDGSGVGFDVLALGWPISESLGKPGGLGNSSSGTGFPLDLSFIASSNCLQIRPYLRAFEEFPSVSATVFERR